MAMWLDKLKQLTGRRARVAAVDFDSRELRLVLAEQAGGRTRILELAMAAVPEDVNASDPQALGARLADVLRRLGATDAGLLMNVARAQAILKPLTLPSAGSVDDLAGMVHYQIGNELPFPAEEAVVDFATESHYDVERTNGTSPASTDVLVAAVRRDVIEFYKRVAEAAGARLLRLGLRPYADRRAVAGYAELDEGECLAVVHLTADEAEIDVLIGSSLAFSRSAVVKLAGGASKEAADAVNTVAIEVARSVRSYHAVERSGPIRMVLVAGSTGLEDMLAEELARRLGLGVERFRPAAALGIEEGEADASGFISALGLAAGHFGRDELPFDFLRPKRPAAEPDQRKRVAVVAGAAAVVLVGGSVLAGSLYLDSHRAELGRLDDQLEAIKTTHARVTDLARRVNAVEEWLRGGSGWLGHWARLSALFPRSTEAYVTALDAHPDGSITLGVRARDTDVLADLAQRLTEAGYTFKPGPVTHSQKPSAYLCGTSIRVMVGDEAVDVSELRAPPRLEDDVSLERPYGEPVMAPPAAPAMAPATPAGEAAGPASEAPDTAPVPEAEALRRWDVDRDGVLSERERRRMEREAERVEMFRHGDADGDGRLSKQELKAMGESRRLGREEP